MPDSVDTPAPPKNTILSLSVIQVFRVSISERIVLRLQFCDKFTLGPRFIREAQLVKQIRPAVQRPQNCLLFLPPRDLRMVAGTQNLRHAQPVPLVRPGILRVFKQSVPMALVGEADLVAEHAGDEA